MMARLVPAHRPALVVPANTLPNLHLELRLQAARADRFGARGAGGAGGEEEGGLW